VRGGQQLQLLLLVLLLLLLLAGEKARQFALVPRHRSELNTCARAEGAGGGSSRTGR
jgi:hypothetical protein